MEVVDLDVIEIKLEDIESDPESPQEQTREFPLKTRRSKINTHLKTPCCRTSTNSDKDILDNGENVGPKGEFQYICNAGKELQVINIDNSDEEHFEKGQPINEPWKTVYKAQIKTVQIVKPLHELTVAHIRDNEKSVSVKTEENLLNGNNMEGEMSKNKYFFDRIIHSHEFIRKTEGYGCFHCPYFSSSWHHMKHHIRLAHRDPSIGQPRKVRYQCPYCPIKAFEIAKHIYTCHRKSSDINWVYCGNCDYKAKTKRALVEHIKVTHTEVSENDFKECKECGKRFKRPDLLARHTRANHNPKKMQLKCDHCDYTSRFKNVLKTHMLRHEVPEGGFTCKECGFQTQKLSEFFKHKRKEHGIWEQCHLCPYRCESKTILKLHLIHHQEKKKEEDLTFRCKKCDYKTYRVYNLNIHMLKHKRPEEIEMFRCYHCDFKANRKDNLKTHIFKHEHYKNVLDCFICSFKTRSRYELKKHVDNHSENQRKEEAEIIDNARTQVDGSKDKKEENGAKKKRLYCRK